MCLKLHDRIYVQTMPSGRLSHTRLIASNHCNSSICFGGKGGAGPTHYAWGTNGVSECNMDVKSTWISTWHQRIMFHDYFDSIQKSTLGGRPNTNPGDHGTPKSHNHWFIIFHHVRGPVWIGFHWNSIWLRTQTHMTSHYNSWPLTTLQNFGSVLEWPLDTSFGFS